MHGAVGVKGRENGVTAITHFVRQGVEWLMKVANHTDEDTATLYRRSWRCVNFILRSRRRRRRRHRQQRGRDHRNHLLRCNRKIQIFLR